jgi:GNAT superfamily N-acetyltransferase
MTAPAKELRAGPRLRELSQPARFLDLQRGFYRGDPHYVPPVTSAEAWQLDPRKNPFFRHAEVGLFAAFAGERCVGRISTSRDRLHDEFHGDRIGFFGHFEAADEPSAHALLAHAAAWCRARGATALRGPVDLSTNYRCGLFVGGDPGPPVVMMPHNPPAYAAWLEAFGLRPAKDLLALHVTDASLDLRRVDRIAEHLAKKSSATMRPVSLRRFDAECELLWDLYHRIWERNWGFVPMARDEFLAQARDMKRIAHPALMHIAEVRGEPVGFVVALPDVNVGARACNGRLLPFGWWRFLRAMKQAKLIRVITLGVVPEFRRLGIEMLLMHRVIRRGLDAGFRACEASWILEDNRDMLGPLETLGHRPYRRYRIYEQPLR